MSLQQESAYSQQVGGPPSSPDYTQGMQSHHSGLPLAE